MDLIPLLAVIGAVVGAVAIFKAFNVSIDDQKKKVEEASTAYDTAKSNLESVNTQLKTAQDRMDVLNAKPKLTFVEKGELEKLLGVTQRHQKELEARLDGVFQTLTIRDFAKRKGFVKIEDFVN